MFDLCKHSRSQTGPQPNSSKYSDNYLILKKGTKTLTYKLGIYNLSNQYVIKAFPKSAAVSGHNK